MTITNRTSAPLALTTIPADLLGGATGGASSATLPNGEPNSLLIGGPAPVSPPTFTNRQDAPFAREYAEAAMRDWVKNANILVDLQKSGWLDLSRQFAQQR